MKAITLIFLIICLFIISCNIPGHKANKSEKRNYNAPYQSENLNSLAFPSAKDLASVDFAPPGEFVKDHTFIFNNGLWHLFSISGPLGKGWDHKDGGERTFSHSVSKDLIHWKLVGHILTPGGPGTIDADRIWAPSLLAWKGTFYLFYSGVIHPNWDRIPGVEPNSPENNFWKGHRVSPCLATSTNLTTWTKQMTTEPIAKGGGQDIFVLYEEERKRFLLYSMGGGGHQVRESEDLRSWSEPVTCSTCSRKEIPWARHDPRESPFVVRHQGLFYLLLNDGYYVSDTPLNFSGVHRYHGNPPGFAGEIIQVGDRFIRSGVEGERDHYHLRMKEVVFKDGTVSFIE